MADSAEGGDRELCVSAVKTIEFFVIAIEVTAVMLVAYVGKVLAAHRDPVI